MRRHDPDVSDVVLVRAAQDGAPWAQEALFKRYASMVSGLAFRLLGRDDGVDDLIQETFAQALAGLHRLQTPETFGSWLGSIVVRTASKVLRTRRLLRRLGFGVGEAIDVEALVSPTAPPDAAAELRAIYRTVEGLPPKLRVPLVLRRVEGATMEEIARMTGTSLSTAKRRLFEAESRLDKALGRRVREVM
jgi:RNA polymerase sigma-70 factor, ECF subfamily